MLISVLFFLVIIAVILFLTLFITFSKSPGDTGRTLANAVLIIAITIVGLLLATRFVGPGLPFRFAPDMLHKFLLLGLAALVIWLLIRGLSSPAGRKALAVLVVVACLAGLFLALFIPVISHRQAVPVTAIRSASETHIAGPLWADGIEQEFAADVYSSPQAAAYSLGRRFFALAQQSESNSQPGEVLLIEGSAPNELLMRFREGLLSQFGSAKIYIGPLPANPPQAGQMVVTLAQNETDGSTIRLPEISRVDNLRNEQWLPAGNQKGTLEAAVQTAAGKYHESAAYDQRQWLDEFPQFVSRHPQGTWLAVASQETATSDFEARQQAENRAVEAVFHLLENSRISLGPNYSLGLEDLKRSGFIADEYSQQFNGLAGPIWRHAVLLEVSPERLAMLRDQRAEIARTVHRSWARLIGSFLGMIAMICVLYAFLNAATKGYYARSLAVFSLLLAAGLGAIIYLFAA